MVGKCCADGRVEGLVEVGVVEDHRRVLSAEFEGELFEFGCSRSGNGRPCGGPPCEGNGADVVVVDHRLSDFGPETVKDVEHAIRQSSFLGPLSQHERCHGRHFAGFGHHAVPAGEGGSDLPGEEVQGEIPRADAPHDAQRLAKGVVHGAIPHGVAFAGKLLGCRSIKAEVLLGPGDVHCGREGHGFAVVLGFGGGEGFGMCSHLVREPGQDGAPVSRGPAPPFGKGVPGGSDRGLHVVLTRTWDAAVHFARGGFYVVQPFAGLRGHVLSAYEIQDVVHRRTRSA